MSAAYLGLSGPDAPRYDALNRSGVVAVVPVAGIGVAMAWPGGSAAIPAGDDRAAAAAVAALVGTPHPPRLIWWSSRQAATALVASGVRPVACWDLGAVGAMLHGLRRDDPAAVWAAAHGLPEPPRRRETLDLFDVDESDGPLRPDGQLSAEWVADGWSRDLGAATRWAELALTLYDRQVTALAALPDPRLRPTGASLAVLVGYAESAAALLAVELEHDGLPLDADVAGALLSPLIGGRDEDAEAWRQRRSEQVLSHFPETGPVDLRSPEQVKGLLARIGLDLPDTRSWRLEPHAATSDAVAAVLAWRKADRLATTYGWRWLDANLGADGRLRGPWCVADGGAGRMTAGSGLHNMPAELRPAVRAAPGRVLVRADLGQVEPRVLATVSGDPALIAAAGEVDMYAPVAAQLRCERPAAKIAVLAAMYGQTSGTAGAALRDMDRVYPRAMAYLRAAQRRGEQREDLRTYGGRLLAFGATPLDAGEDAAQRAARGRYARNAAIQGAAAELFKAWAATVRHALREIDARIVLCLHDELLVDSAVALEPELRRILDDGLQSTVRWWAAGSAVRFVAEISSAESWADCH